MERLLYGIYVPFLALLAVAYYFRAPLNAWLLVNAAVYPLALLLGLAVHEAGHAVAALLLGMSVPRIEIGLGRRVGAWRLGRTSLRLNSWPLDGFTFPAPKSRSALKVRVWLMIAAGPAASFALMRIAAPADLGFWRSIFPFDRVTNGFVLPELIAYVGWLGLVVNLWPFKLGGGIGTVTDGERLLTLPFQRRQHVEEMLNTATIMEADELREAGRFDDAQLVVTRALGSSPQSFGLRHSLAVLHLHRGAARSARALFLQLAAEPAPLRISGILVRSHLAWTDFLIRTDDLKEEADRNSAEAFDALPNVPWVLSTRGTVLMWLGRPTEARPLLERAYLMNGDAQSRAVHACTLAMLEASIGKEDDARKWLSKAQAADAKCWLLKDAETAIANAARPTERTDGGAA